MTNRERRRILKEAAREARVVAMDGARERQGKATEHKPPVITGCGKRRRRKHTTDDVMRLMQSDKGYLRPYYDHEFRAVVMRWHGER